MRLNGTPQSILKGLYCHRLTSRCAQEKRAKAKQGQAFQQISEEAKMLIHQRLKTHTSPDVISQELIREHNIQVSESTIYRYIYDDREQGGELYKTCLIQENLIRRR
ncbi:hypothetical protein [Piscirickettsia salmonis]|uniref:hypothetical protein n=1 Tax=Piscirickettsia salmonis TaxID=1238 RepID=UPI001E56A30A|nr:hypothetical protein [Piscirickettsia salmonis]